MPLERYREWKRRNNAVGCMFARVMAVDPGRYGYRNELVHGNAPALVATAIANRVTNAVSDPSVSSLALVLPDIQDLPRLVGIASALASTPCWQVSKTLVQNSAIGDVVTFRVTREIPFAGTTCPSEMLALGPFPNAFPATRCAPVTALELYVGDPPSTNFDGKPTTKGHLALVDMPQLSKRKFDKLKEMTQTMRLSSLGGIDDQRAKARVTFSVPLTLATFLGCWP